MNLIFRFVLFLLGNHAKARMLRDIRAKGVIFYLRAIQTSRLLLIGALTAFLVLQVMMISGFGMLLTGFWLWDTEAATKVEILFWIFTGLFSVPFVLLLILLSERLWFRLSGAKDIAS